MMDMQEASRLWKQGISAPNIAKRYGVTKGVVAGIMSRNRNLFPKRNDSIDRLEREIVGALFDSIREDEKRVTSNALRKLFHETANPTKPTKKESHEYDLSRLPHAKTLVDLPSNGCKFPVNESESKSIPHLFCAETRKPGKPWCEAHHARAWRER